MLFLLKKFVSFWLMPLPLIAVFLIVGVALIRNERRKRLGRTMLVIGLGLFVAFSNKAVSSWLIRPLEAAYSAIPEISPQSPLPPALASCRYVVVLGSGHNDAVGLSATNKLSTAGLGRLVEGVRLAQALPGAKLIVSGPADGRGTPHAQVLARAAEALGIDPRRVIRTETALDTEDEAQAVRALVGSERVALVTSAWHMPRASGLFRKAGVAVLPCPADFRGRNNFDFRWRDYSWDVESLERSTFAVREYIGYVWVWLRGKV